MSHRTLLSPIRILFTLTLFSACFTFSASTLSALAQKEAPTTSLSVSANSLKGHLSFLASDALEGRGTPSRGLNLAAEYIAAQFRRAGLEPLGDDGYFQTTTYTPRAVNGAEPKPERVCNVIGILRGSDPTLKETAILVTGHYDHLGIRPAKADGSDAEADRLYNGANDDGSGTVGVLELAEAISKLQKRPKRSIVFMTFYGEERGLVGSRYYGAHPIIPLEKTIAHINLEQIGRTDDTEGPRVGAACMTGFDFSDIGPIFARIGKQNGMEITKHPQYSDAFFARSDNQALADLGIPAHTICTAFEYPDYHKPSDTWDKIDYNNMAKVLKTVGLGVLEMANSNIEPHWNPENPKAKRYLEAWQARHVKKAEK